MWIASASSLGVSSPKCAGTACSRLVRGPRPSSLRAAAKTAARPTSWPPPQSPVIGPSDEKPRVAAVRGHADAVDARAADNGDSPAPVRAGPEDGERVVANRDARGPAACEHRLAERLLLDREVDAGHQQLGGRDRQLELARRLGEQRPEHRDPALEPEVVRRAARAAHEREQAAFGADEREVRLRVAAVDGQDHGLRLTEAQVRPAARRRTSSSSASSYWPISGWVSSALRATTRSPVSAASTARRSYAATCWTSPSSSGASGAWGSATGPFRSTARGHLDDVVGREPLERPSVSDVYDVHPAAGAE